MKKLILSLLSLLLLTVACNKDNVTTVNDTTAGGGDDGIDTTGTSGTDYDRTVTIVFSETGDATVTGTSGDLTATVEGNGVTIRNLGSDKVMYNLSGSTGDGYLKIYSGRKQGLTLGGVSIKNSDGAAINIQGLEETPNKGKRADILLVGSNTLADGGTYSRTPEGEDEKAALFSEGQMVFGGEGTLTVTATGKAGITSDDYLHFAEGCAVTVSSSAGHGVRGKDYILVSGGTLDITVTADGKKGMSSDSLVRFDGGETTVRVTGNTVVESGDTARSACIKADRLFEMYGGTLTLTNSGKGGKGISGDGQGLFNGGTVRVTVTGSNFGTSGGGGGGHGPGGWGGSSSDNSVGAKGIKFDGNLTFGGSTVVCSASNHEAIESKGTIDITGGEVYAYSSDDAINSASTMTISGGMVCAHSTGNDGLDANGNLYIQGGVVYAIGKASPEMAIDANTEGGYKLYIQGGIVFAIGNLENGAQLTQSCWQSSSWTKNVWYSMTVGDETYCFKTPASGGTKLVVSAPSQPEMMRSVTVSGGTEHLNGMALTGAECSGGNSVTLTTYSSGGGGGWW